MADEVDSKSIGGDTVRVQVPQPALLGRGEDRSHLKHSGAAVFSFWQKRAPAKG